MADSILQLYASTLGAGVSNAAAFADFPQRGKIRKIQFMPVIRGFLSGDFTAWAEVSTLPTNRMFNNGDYGNVMARSSWTMDTVIATSGGASSGTLTSQEITGLDFRAEVGLRVYLHIYMSATPATQDEWVVNLYIDA